MSPQDTSKKADDIFHELRRRILAGEIGPGERLAPERELAAQLNTNRNTLREAIRRLEEGRLVSARQGSGVTVRDFRKSATIDILEPYLVHGTDAAEKTRVLADLLASRTQVLEYVMTLAVQRATGDSLATLNDLTDMVLAAYERGDRALVASGYHRWLEALIDSSHSLPARWISNPFLDLTRSIIEHYPALWVTDESFPRYLVRCVDAIATHDPVAAAAATRDYYDSVDRHILAMLRHFLDGFSGAPPEPQRSAREYLTPRTPQSNTATAPRTDAGDGAANPEENPENPSEFSSSKRRRSTEWH